MSERLSDDDLDRLDELEDAAAPGPWFAKVYIYGPSERVRVTSPSDDDEYNTADEVLVADAEFIAAAREALPALLAEVREHRAREVADERDRVALGTTPESVTDAGFAAISDWWAPGKSDAYATVLVPALVETITDAAYAATRRFLEADDE